MRNQPQSVNGQLGTVQSSARFKDDIKPMNKTSEAILALKPVTFRYKQELDPEKIPQFGLIAEDVEKVDPDLVVRDDDGKVTTVRYEAVNAMLLNEFLKEHRKVEEQAHKVREQETTMSQLESTAAKQEAAIARLKSTVATQEAALAQQQVASAQQHVRIERQQRQIEALTEGFEKVSAQVSMSGPALQMVDNDH